MRCCLSFLAVLLLSTAATLSSQDLKRPAGWIVKADDPVADMEPGLEFAEMPPGWHVTTGPAVILYDPALVASGSFRVEAETYRFPGECASGFGFFLGGRDLEGAAPKYFAFLIDRDGRFELHHRAGDTVHPPSCPGRRVRRLRVGEDVNLHVTRLAVTPLAEPDAD